MNRSETIALATALTLALACSSSDDSGGTDSVGPQAALSSFSDVFDIGRQVDLGEGVSVSNAIADFDGDGRLDVAVSYDPNSFAPFADAEVVVFTIDAASGRLVERTRLSGLTTSGDVIATDLDLDGRTDLIVTDAGNVLWFAGRGDGTFVDPVATAIADGPSATRVSDVDSDGIPDLVVGLADSGDIVLLLGLGGGALAAPERVETSLGQSDSRSFVVGDVDGDGNDDVVVGGGTGSVVVLTGDGSGGFSSELVSAPGPLFGGLTIADLDGDGDGDLMGPRGERFVVTERLSDGSFVEATSFPGAGGGAVAVDLDGDGWLDLVTGRIAGVAVVKGTADAFVFDRIEYFVGPAAPAVAVADLSGDGVLDVCASLTIRDVFQNERALVTVIRGDGEGGLDAPKAFRDENRIWSVETADFDFDGALDIATSSSDVVSVFLRDIDGRLVPSASYPTGGGISGLDAVDLDGDLSVDLFVSRGNDLPSDVQVLPGLGDGTFGASVPIATYPTGAGFALLMDANLDQIPDVFVPRQQDQEAELLLGNGDGSFADPIVSSVERAPSLTRIADVNRDGREDVVGASHLGGMTVMLSDGTGAFPTTISVPVEGSISGIAVADFRGGPAPDVVLSTNTSVGFEPVYTLRFFEGNGDGTFFEAETEVLESFNGILEFIDVNEDGQPDLFLSTGFGAQIRLGRSDGTLAAPTTLYTSIVLDVEQVDFDGDGARDLVLAVGDGFAVLRGRAQ